jgi:hypothetical protein
MFFFSLPQGFALAFFISVHIIDLQSPANEEITGSSRLAVKLRLHGYRLG